MTTGLISHRPKRPTDGKRNHRLALILIICLGLFLRMGWLVYSRPIPVSDFARYLTLGGNLLAHGQFGYPTPTAQSLPLYPSFLTLVMMLSKSVTWLSICNIMLSSLLIWLVYQLSLQLSNRNIRLALYASLLCALNPTFLFFSPILASENLFVPLVIGALWLILMNGHASFLRTLLAGFLMGFACLTRGEAMFYMIAFIVITYCVTESKVQRFLYPALLGAICIAVVFPWYLRNRKIFGPGVGISTSSGVNFYIAHSDRLYGYKHFNMDDSGLKGLDEINAHKSGFKLGLENIGKNPAGFLYDVVQGTFWLYAPCWYPVSWSSKAPYPTPSYTGCYEIPLRGKNLFKVLSIVFYVCLMVMAVLSVIYLKMFPARSWIYLLLIVLCNWFCFAVVFWGKGRYRFIIEVLLCIFAGIALSNIFRPAKQRDT